MQVDFPQLVGVNLIAIVFCPFATPSVLSNADQVYGMIAVEIISLEG